MVKKDQKKAYIFAVISVLLWSTVATAFKLTLRETGYVELLLMSSLFSFFALFFLLLFQKKLYLLKKLRPGDYVDTALLGFLNPFLYYLIIFKAYSLLPAQLAQPLNQIWGVVIVLFSIPLLKQKVTIKTFAGVLVSFFGVFVLSTEGKLFSFEIKEPFGVFLALFSSIVWSLYWIYNTRSRRDPVVSLFLCFVFGLIFILIYLLLFHQTFQFSFLALAGSLYIGVFEMGITYVLWLKALKFTITTAKISILIYLVPFISLIFIKFILGEKILLSSLAGLVFIISGILISRTKNVSNIKP
ncbi:MAG: DMT family transporter [Acidobacteriota bacterium]